MMMDGGHFYLLYFRKLGYKQVTHPHTHGHGDMEGVCFDRYRLINICLDPFL